MAPVRSFSLNNPTLKSSNLPIDSGMLPAKRFPLKNNCRTRTNAPIHSNPPVKSHSCNHSVMIRSDPNATGTFPPRFGLPSNFNRINPGLNPSGGIDPLNALERNSRSSNSSRLINSWGMIPSRSLSFILRPDTNPTMLQSTPAHSHSVAPVNHGSDPSNSIGPSDEPHRLSSVEQCVQSSPRVVMYNTASMYRWTRVSSNGHNSNGSSRTIQSYACP
mmetsp:Transcript_7740/g.22745  ORF Transcript_7740/g.22745 Transcript_7740/m.22745 type:complete len:218 (+) Transcript_7740:233-886(+)